MTQKPEIQYVGQFYVYGSEAVAPKKKEVKELIPKEKKEKLHRIYIDPLAIVGIVAAIGLLTALVMGGIRLTRMWEQRNYLESYVSHLSVDNATLHHNYRISYDLKEIEKMALDMGLVPESEVETRYVRVTVPAHKQEPTLWENIKWFFEGLF